MFEQDLVAKHELAQYVVDKLRVDDLCTRYLRKVEHDFKPKPCCCRFSKYVELG